MPALPDSPRHRLLIGGAIILTITAAIAVLRWEGQNWWCACGTASLWNGDIWSAHCSQHLLDPYAFTHMLHGVLFYFLAALLLRGTPLPWRLWAATLAESAWEVLENSPIVIQRYREATISLGYTGDSILNSVADIGCCMAGFALAKGLGLRRSLWVYAITELVLLVTIRDNLTLNVLMLVCPVDSIKAWQMVH